MRISDWSSDVCSSDLTKQIRVDRDYAAFGEVSFDITEQLTLTGGGRVYKFDNSLVGFFGYSNPGFSSNPVYACQGPAVVDGSPCTNLDKRTKKTDFIHKLNLTYKFSDEDRKSTRQNSSH